MYDKKRVGVFVDTSILYHKVQRKFTAKLCYDAYYEVCKSFGTIIKAVAYGMRIDSETYGVQIDNEVGGFINCLKIAGFDVQFKRPKILRFGDRTLKFCNWDSVMTLDIVQLVYAGGLDVVIIGSANLDLIPLIKWIRTRGIFVIILAADVPSVFQNIADKVVEITEKELEDDDE